MTLVVPIKLSGALPLDYSVGFAWQQPGGLTSNINGFDNSPRWANTYKNYEQFAVTGMSLKWIPGNIRGVANPSQNQNVGSFVGPVFLYSDIDTYNTLAYTENKIVGLDKSSVKEPTRMWKAYYGCKSLSKSMNVPWQDCAAYTSTAYNTLTKASTAIKFQFQGFASPETPVAYVKATWYITFKG